MQTCTSPFIWHLHSSTVDPKLQILPCASAACPAAHDAQLPSLPRHVGESLLAVASSLSANSRTNTGLCSCISELTPDQLSPCACANAVYGLPCLGTVQECVKDLARSCELFSWHELESGFSSTLGCGSSGTVYKGLLRGAQVAVKALHIEDSSAGAIACIQQHFISEVHLQCQLPCHPNVVRFIGACFEPSSVYLDAASAAQNMQLGTQQSLQQQLHECLTSGQGQHTVSHENMQTQQCCQQLRHQLQCSYPFMEATCTTQQLQPPRLAIAMELCNAGTVYNLIGRAQLVQPATHPDQMQPSVGRASSSQLAVRFASDWTTRLWVLQGAAAGLEHLHKHGVVHSDFTSYNLLLSTDSSGGHMQLQAKVCDFSLSRSFYEANELQLHYPEQPQQENQLSLLPSSGSINSPGWQSPEVLSGQPYGLAADVFSFGVVMWEVLTLKRPWRTGTLNEPSVFQIIDAVTGGQRLPLPKPQELVERGLKFDHANTLTQLIAACWAQMPQQRPRMAEVHAIIQYIIKDTN